MSQSDTPGGKEIQKMLRLREHEDADLEKVAYAKECGFIKKATFQEFVIFSINCARQVLWQMALTSEGLEQETERLSETSARRSLRRSRRASHLERRKIRPEEATREDVREFLERLSQTLSQSVSP